MAHSDPAGECLLCCSLLDTSSYAEYSTSEANPQWYPCAYCQTCIETYFIAQQWKIYLKSIEEADCAAALKRVLARPPPTHVSDRGMPTSQDPYNTDGQVYLFWFASDRQVHSARLIGALDGEERKKFWLEKRAFLNILEKLEEDAQTAGKNEVSTNT